MSQATIMMGVHTQGALLAAIKEFQKTGFVYEVTVESHSDFHIKVHIDANAQEIMALGVKTGYLLAHETMPSQKMYETIADIAFAAGEAGYYTGNSRADIQTFIHWAEEFEKAYSKVNWDESDLDYMTQIQEYTSAKMLERKEEQLDDRNISEIDAEHTAVFNKAVKLLNDIAYRIYAEHELPQIEEGGTQYGIHFGGESVNLTSDPHKQIIGIVWDTATRKASLMLDIDFMVDDAIEELDSGNVEFGDIRWAVEQSEAFFKDNE